MLTPRRARTARSQSRGPLLFLRNVATGVVLSCAHCAARSVPAAFIHESSWLLVRPAVVGPRRLAEKERPEREARDRQLCSSLREGHTFSTALQRQPEVFPSIYVATARASEKTGDLREALARYVAYRSRLDVVRNKIVTASMYPLLLLGAGGLVCLFLMFYVPAIQRNL